MIITILRLACAAIQYNNIVQHHINEDYRMITGADPGFQVRGGGCAL